MQLTSTAQLQTATMADLVETYNFLSNAKKPVKKFESRLIGQRRVAEIFAKMKKDGVALPAPAPAEAAMKNIAKTVAGTEAMAKALEGDAVRAPKAAAKKAAKDASAPRKSGSKYALTDTITVVAATNPKREGTLAHDEFEFYKRAKTVKAYVDMGGQLAYLNYDAKRGFIKVGSGK